jgi:hypothetical protein
MRHWTGGSTLVVIFVFSLVADLLWKRARDRQRSVGADAS